MPSFSRYVEATLHRSLALATERAHEYATLEHLLLALLTDRDAERALAACGADLEALRASVTAYIDGELDNIRAKPGQDAKPTAGFQRVIQRAVIHVQAAGREEIDGANVLVALFAERESHAAGFLQEQDLTRYDVVNYLSRRVGEGDASPGRRERPDETGDEGRPGTSPHQRARRSRERPAAPAADRRKRAAARRRVSRKLAEEPDAIRQLAAALARLAEMEIAALRDQRPNSREAGDRIEAQIDLMSLFLQGFSRIADTLGAANASTASAADEVLSVADALRKWWQDNNQKAVNVALGTPVAVGACGLMKLIGADPAAQLVATGVTASAWFGPGVIRSAISLVRRTGRAT